MRIVSSGHVGIGTTSLPAPAFPVNGAIIAAFASKDLTAFLDLFQLLLMIGLSFIVAYFSPDIAIGVVIGIFFPPHMAIMMSLGGIIRILYRRKVGKQISDDKGVTIATGLAVGTGQVGYDEWLASLPTYYSTTAVIFDVKYREEERKQVIIGEFTAP